MDRIYLSTLQYNHTVINEKRSHIRTEFIKNSLNIKDGDIKSISPKDLELLFHLYDSVFFNEYFKNFFKGKTVFSLSQRMTRSAGKTIVPKKNSPLFPLEELFEIRIGVNFFFDFNKTEGSKRVSGHETIDSLNAMQIVFEHELCHIIEFYVFGNSNCKSARFKVIAKNIFEHTDVFHELPTRSEVIRVKLGLKIGDKVYFMSDGSKHTGVIKSINKRATIMVQNNNGNYADRNGKRYEKWYVPIENLQL